MNFKHRYRISKLKSNEHEIIKHLFIGPEFALLLHAIWEGNSPAQIWTDDRSNPKSVFLWDKANNVFYLSGNYDNSQFNSDLSELLVRKVIPELRLKQRTHFRLRTTSEDWTSQLSSIFVKADLKAGRYMFYSLKAPANPNWKDKIPTGFKLELIDEDFLFNSRYDNIKVVMKEVRQMWSSIDCFINCGFGFSLVTSSKVVSWCTSEYMSKYRCGIGIETLQEYQNRGLATIAASAFVEHSLRRNIKPHWEYNMENLASRRVAKKVGFVKELDYPIYFGMFS
jgi:hypothetical protein